MERECLTCGKKSSDKKLFYELSAKTGLRFICRDCAAEVGINNMLSAGFHSNTGVLKKYVQIHPEAQSRLDMQLGRLEKRKEDLQKELKEFSDKRKEQSAIAAKRAGCKKQQQTKCTCTSCKNVFYFGDYDVVKNAANIFHGSLYSLNQVKDLQQCPKCGSRAITQKTVYFWVDKKGNCVDIEE